MNFGICRDPGTNPPQIPRDNCMAFPTVHLKYEFLAQEASELKQTLDNERDGAVPLGQLPPLNIPASESLNPHTSLPRVPSLSPSHSLQGPPLHPSPQVSSVQSQQFSLWDSVEDTPSPTPFLLLDGESDTQSWEWRRGDSDEFLLWASLFFFLTSFKKICPAPLGLVSCQNTHKTYIRDSYCLQIQP